MGKDAGVRGLHEGAERGKAMEIRCYRLRDAVNRMIRFMLELGFVAENVWIVGREDWLTLYAGFDKAEYYEAIPVVGGFNFEAKISLEEILHLPDNNRCAIADEGNEIQIISIDAIIRVPKGDYGITLPNVDSERNWHIPISDLRCMAKAIGNEGICFLDGNPDRTYLIGVSRDRATKIEYSQEFCHHRPLAIPSDIIRAICEIFPAGAFEGEIVFNLGYGNSRMNIIQSEIICSYSIPDEEVIKHRELLERFGK